VGFIGLVIGFRRGPANLVPVGFVAPPLFVAPAILAPLGLGIIAFGWGGYLYLQEAKPPANAYQIDVVAKQWMWKAQHPGGQEEIDEIHVPVGQPVRINLTSQDVVHDFSVPDFRIRYDVMPGQYTTVWFEATQPGQYQLYCAQYCGASHPLMTGWVIAMTRTDFANWLTNGRAYLSPAGKGEQLFNQLGCNTCHRNDTYRRAPVLEGLYGRPVQLNNGQTVIADDAYVRESILNPGAKIVNGWENIMPSFSGRLTDAQVDSLVAYVHSIGGPNPAVPPPSPPNNLILTPTAGS
jgi:cytochrome c oxidase subunit 2